MDALHNPVQNRLLARLEHSELHRLLPYLELITLAHGEVLYQVEGKMVYAYFPTTATISIDYLLEDGGTSEIARVGNDGMLGVALFMGGQSSAGRALVQAAGYAYRISAARLMEEFYHKGPMLQLLLRYTQVRLTQISQLAVCNSHHTTRQRVCGYLLQMQDRSSADEMAVTQEEIGAALGVRRESITDAARLLKKLGIIKWRRGYVTILNRVGLNEHVCECYAIVRGATLLLLPELPAMVAREKSAWCAGDRLTVVPLNREKRRRKAVASCTLVHVSEQAEFTFV
ncbi:Crp/Fnr family transcriptional regulator [Pseudoduganella sp. SL102]|uniref:Crp/Fnr family transcriptional regulator n=1 Tax=Pseudoduganella sp. SL102 TaxID=2995154 RepID=UPI00248BA652|nr:Crp/Fnr family transcriptional regulator [Pseudoduganella sp. SL102]WBS00095.1 Crp/Fnr family transcriptional regulator [Pseudoduganella sp. SL102]